MCYATSPGNTVPGARGMNPFPTYLIFKLDMEKGNAEAEKVTERNKNDEQSTVLPPKLVRQSLKSQSDRSG